MHEKLNEIYGVLLEIEEQIYNLSEEDRTINEMFGWQFASVNRIDLSNIAGILAKRLNDANLESLDDDQLNTIGGISDRLELLREKTEPNLLANNASAVPAFSDTMQTVESILVPLIGWEVNNNSSYKPASITRRLRSLSARINTYTDQIEDLDEKIGIIQSAHDAAESLPVDMESLKDAKLEISTHQKSSEEATKEIAGCLETSLKAIDDLTQKKTEAQDIIQTCETALNSATSMGLAGAFNDRAKALSRSMFYWVLGLLGALIAGWWIGSERIESLVTYLQSDSLSGIVVVAHMVLAVIGLGAPLWFAWISTKQIGHQFRLAEDYSFKAAMAKAYEGYRREAAKIDPVFEARLFSSALSRLDEAPLRFVEGKVHSSPVQELVGSKEFQEALEALPELRDKFISIVNKRLPGKSSGLTTLLKRTKKTEKKNNTSEPEDENEGKE